MSNENKKATTESETKAKKTSGTKRAIDWLNKDGPIGLAIGVIAVLLSAISLLWIDRVDNRIKQDELNLKIDAARKSYLDELKGDFDNQRHAIKSIATLEGVDIAVRLERAFRSGGTITGLKEFMRESTNTCGFSDEALHAIIDRSPRRSMVPPGSWGKDLNANEIQACLNRLKILEALRDAPIAVFIDAREHENAPSDTYCSTTQVSRGTNLDDIFEIVRDQPMFIERHIGNLNDESPCVIINRVKGRSQNANQTRSNCDWRDALDADRQAVGESGRALDERPDLIVMHASAFESIPYTACDRPNPQATGQNRAKVKCFLEAIIDETYTPTVIIYSRGRVNLEYLRQDLSAGGQYIETINLEGNDSVENSACWFANNLENIPVGERRTLAINGVLIKNIIERQFSDTLGKQSLRCVRGASSAKTRRQFDCP